MCRLCSSVPGMSSWRDSTRPSVMTTGRRAVTVGSAARWRGTIRVRWIVVSRWRVRSARSSICGLPRGCSPGRWRDSTGSPRRRPRRSWRRWGARARSCAGMRMRSRCGDWWRRWRCRRRRAVGVCRRGLRRRRSARGCCRACCGCIGRVRCRPRICGPRGRRPRACPTPAMRCGRSSSGGCWWRRCGSRCRAISPRCRWGRGSRRGSSGSSPRGSSPSSRRRPSMMISRRRCASAGSAPNRSRPG